MQPATPPRAAAWIRVATLVLLASAPLVVVSALGAQDTASVPPRRDSASVAPSADTIPPPLAPIIDSIQPGACNGQVISAIEVERQPPAVIQNRGWFTRAALKVVLQHSTTKERVIRVFLQFKVGQPCSPLGLAETERILRAQPFIATASVVAVQEANGLVRIDVRTVDEVPPIIGASFSGTHPSSLLLGNGNMAGQGVLVAANWEDGDGRRDGLGMRFEDYRAFNRPMTFTLDAQRRPQGSSVDVGLGRSFLTNLQRFAWHGGYTFNHDYQGFAGPEQSDIVLPLERSLFHLGGVTRLEAGRGAILLGGVLTRETADPQNPQVTTPLGNPPISDTVITRFPGYENMRVSAVLGYRNIDYLRVRGFDMLGEQDVARGIQLITYAGKSVPWFGDSDRDYFFSTDAYAAIGSVRSFIGLRLQSEIRRDLTQARWDGLVTSARIAWHLRQSDTRTLMLTGEVSSLWRERLPSQLTLSDTRGGLRGFNESRLTGGDRVVMRAEEHWLRGHITTHAAWGLSAFTDVGGLWAGDSPYGVSTGVKASVGAGLLVAIPPQSRRIYALEVAVPLTSGAGRAVQLRFSTKIPLRDFWSEPGDVHRVRAGVPASGIFTWP